MSSKLIDIVSYALKMGINGYLYVILGHKIPVNWLLCISVNIHVSTQNMGDWQNFILHNALSV